MSRSLAQLKHRNGARRARYHQWEGAKNFFQKSGTGEIKRLVREDLRTGEITETNRSKMNWEVLWFNTFEPIRSRRKAMPQSLVWEELESGAVLYTENAKFWIEKLIVAARAA